MLPGSRMDENILYFFREAGVRCLLFPYDLDQDSFPPPAVEFTVKDLFPRAEIKAAARNCNHHLPPHD